MALKLLKRCKEEEGLQLEMALAELKDLVGTLSLSTST